jgi:hypothetical protein
MELPTGGGNSNKVKENPPKTPLIFLTTYVNQYKIKILIDTGANSTFINENILPFMVHPRYIQRKSFSFTLADGKAPFQVSGLAELSIQFANTITKIQAHIARQLCVDMIIGMDYINSYNLNIDVKHQKISIEKDDQLWTMDIDREYDLRRIPVTLSQSMHIPPQSDRSTQVSTLISSVNAPFVPISQFLKQNSLITRYTFLNFQDYQSYLVFFNDSPYTRFLKKGTCIGFMFCYSSDRTSPLVSETISSPRDVIGLSGMTSVICGSSVNRFTDCKSSEVTGITGVTSGTNDLFPERVKDNLVYNNDNIISPEIKERNDSNMCSVCNTIQVRDSAVEEHIRLLSSKIIEKEKQEEVYSLLKCFRSTFDTSKHNIAHTPIHHVINTIPHSPPACRAYPQPDKEETMYKLIQEFLQAIYPF